MHYSLRFGRLVGSVGKIDTVDSCLIEAWQRRRLELLLVVWVVRLGTAQLFDAEEDSPYLQIISLAFDINSIEGFDLELIAHID